MSHLLGSLASSQSVHAPRPHVNWTPEPIHRRLPIIKTKARSHSVRKWQCVNRPEVAEGTVSLYAISDLHTDHHANMAWVQGLHSQAGSATASNPTDVRVLLVAGDISDDMGLLRATLEALSSKFHVVSFVPGNHELWVKGQPGSQEAHDRNAGATDSIAKLHKVLQLCQDLNVLTQPAQIGGLYLVPLLSWHHQSWDKEADIPGIPRASAMTIADYAACVWPQGFPGAETLGSAETAAWFDEQNESIQEPGWTRLQQVLQSSRSAAAAATHDVGRRQQQHLDVVSGSHFLPHQGLLPEKRFLSYPNLAKAVGSDYLWQRLVQLQPDLHVFGHSHFAWDAHVDGLRYIQAPLCYPNERRHRVKSVILQNTPHMHDSSSNSSEYDHHHHRQQQQVQGAEAPDHHVANVPWLPVRVYQAQYKAQLATATAGTPKAMGSSSTSSSSNDSFASLLWQHGLPVLHSSQLQQQYHQRGQGEPQAAAARSGSGTVCSSSSSTDYYAITHWQSSWCSNLFGVWSEYYKVTQREPDNTELAPWVAKRYRKYPRLAQRLAANSSSR